MDKDQALREVHEIRQVMEESRKRTNRGKYWIVIAAAVLAMVVSGLIPPLAPVIGLGMIAAGIIIWRRNDETLMKGIAAGLIAIGIVLVLLAVFVIIGLVAYQTVGGPFPANETVVPVPRP